MCVCVCVCVYVYVGIKMGYGHTSVDKENSFDNHMCHSCFLAAIASLPSFYSLPFPSQSISHLLTYP